MNFLDVNKLVIAINGLTVQFQKFNAVSAKALEHYQRIADAAERAQPTPEQRDQTFS